MKRRVGLTLIEVTIAVVVATVMILGTAAAFSESFQAIEQSERIGTAGVFLGTTMEDVSAVAFDDLVALDGDRVFDAATLAESEFVVDLSVFLTEVDLIQITAVLTDRRSGSELGRTNLLRSRR